jgi:hypothetical protein
MDNTQKIMDISLNMPEGFTFDGAQNFDETTVDFTQLTDLNDDSEENEIVGTNLKELIESEINAAI